MSASRVLSPSYCGADEDKDKDNDDENDDEYVDLKQQPTLWSMVMTTLLVDQQQ